MPLWLRSEDISCKMQATQAELMKRGYQAGSNEGYTFAVRLLKVYMQDGGWNQWQHLH